jgi:hypothetical protein
VVRRRTPRRQPIGARRVVGAVNARVRAAIATAIAMNAREVAGARVSGDGAVARRARRATATPHVGLTWSHVNIS